MDSSCVEDVGGGGAWWSRNEGGKEGKVNVGVLGGHATSSRTFSILTLQCGRAGSWRIVRRVG